MGIGTSSFPVHGGDGRHPWDTEVLTHPRWARVREKHDRVRRMWAGGLVSMQQDIQVMFSKPQTQLPYTALVAHIIERTGARPDRSNKPAGPRNGWGVTTVRVCDVTADPRSGLVRASYAAKQRVPLSWQVRVPRWVCRRLASDMRTMVDKNSPAFRCSYHVLTPWMRGHGVYPKDLRTRVYIVLCVREIYEAGKGMVDAAVAASRVLGHRGKFTGLRYYCDPRLPVVQGQLRELGRRERAARVSYPGETFLPPPKKGKEDAMCRLAAVVVGAHPLTPRQRSRLSSRHPGLVWPPWVDGRKKKG